MSSDDVENLSDSYYRVGNDYYEKGQFVKAIYYYSKAINTSPKDNPNLWKYFYNRGLANACQEEYQKALSDLQKVRELKPDFAEGCYILGLCYEYMQKPDKAIEQFRKALELNPDFKDAKNRLELVESRSHQSSISRTDPVDHSATLNQAQSLEQAGKCDEALELVEEALKKDPNDFRLLLSRQVILAKIEASKKPEVICGLEEPQDEINMHIIRPLTVSNPLYRTKLAQSSKGVILYGPPGGGKNYLISNLAKAAGIEMIFIMLYEVLDKWAGESEKRLKTLFYDARDRAEKGPVIVFVNELDALGSVRGVTSESEESSWSRDLRNTFRMLLDEVQKSPNLIVVGATNYIWSVDSALKRGSGRLGGCIIYVGPPDEKTRESMFRLYSEEIPGRKGVDFEKLARETQWFTGADIQEICRKVLFKVAAEGDGRAVAKTEYYEGFIEKTFPVALAWLREVAEDWVNGKIKDDIDERLMDDVCRVDPLAKMKREELNRARERALANSATSGYIS